MNKLSARTGSFSIHSSFAITVIYSLLLCAVTISSVRASDYPKLDEALPRGYVTSTFAPVFDFDTDGCLPSSAISRSGQQNIGEPVYESGILGMKIGLSRTDDCYSRNFLDTSNTFHRYVAITDDGGSAYSAHFYGLYFEKDRTSYPFPYGAAYLYGHRHDWEYAVIWTTDGELTHVSTSAHGELTTRDASSRLFQDGHPKIVYHQDGLQTHAMRFAISSDTSAENPNHAWVTPTIASWYELTGDEISNAEMREKLSTFPYGSAQKDQENGFLDRVNQWKPSSYPDFTQESSWASNPNNPVLRFGDGDASFFREGSDYVLDFGSVLLGSHSLSAMIAVTNLVVEQADTLDGVFDISGAAPFVLTGFDGFSGLGWGESLDGLLVEIGTEGLGVGVVTGMVEFTPIGQIDSGERVRWDDPIVLTLRLEIVPEPSALSLLALGMVGLLNCSRIATRRRR